MPTSLVRGDRYRDSGWCHSEINERRVQRGLNSINTQIMYFVKAITKVSSLLTGVCARLHNSRVS